MPTLIPDFANLIVTYNNRADVPGLLSDLDRYAQGTQIHVVDNASPDGTADLIQTSFPDVHLVRNDTNVGYARAVNQGFDLSDTPYVFLLNPDIRVHSAKLFETLRECLEAEARVAVAGPLQFKDGGRRPHLNFTWSYWSPRAFKVYWSHHVGRGPAPSGPIKVRFLNAGCLFIRRSAFEATGGLNEKYFLYGEEPDLFFKLIRYRYECRLVPAVSVTHARERSLRSVPAFRRARFKLAGVLNITDAVIRGVGNILMDRLTRRKPA